MSAPVPSEVTRRAAEWVVQQHSPDRSASSLSEFADWLRASPIHVAEYLRAIALWDALGDERLEPALSIDELISEARQAGATPLPIGRATVRGETSSAVVRRAAAAAVCVALLCAAWITWHWRAPLELTTGIGEQRSTVLPDGSIVELNTRSEVRVRYSTSQRRIELVRGEAFFQVASNRARPFVVVTDLATATAVGTRFSVYRAAKGTIVTVEEGRVLVRDIARDRGAAERSTNTQGVEVEPGIQAEAEPSRPVQMHRADIRRWLAWRQRRLVFEGAPLEEVIEEFNRYNPIPLELVDPRLGERRISGVFGANDPESLVDFLTKVDHIPVTSDSRAIRIGGDANVSP